VGVVVLSGILVLMKIYREQTRKVAAKLTGMLPESIRAKLIETLDALLDGIVPLKKKNHYAVVTALTALIWVCYVASFQVIFYCFDLVGVYSLPWTASLVLLVITTISVVVPSSPGYVGTYHFLCMSSLAFFNVPEAVSLSYAFIMHGINFFPIIVVGLVLVSFSKFSLKNFYKERG
ncbi:MAG: flippase-like domain-containing protein, partial [bacterium]|nr:flippase-like domain-containing protein [bacterium]